MKKAKKQPSERLGKLSLYPLTLEESLRAFLQTDPEAVRRRLEAKGIVEEKIADKRKSKTKK